MRGNGFVFGVLMVATAALSACGTINDGGTQIVDVVVKGSPTASCEFTTSKFRNQAHFPNKMTLERSRETLHADCRGEQNRHVAFDIPSRLTQHGSTGNVVTGIIPGVAYDALGGSLWAYPDPIIVDFREIGEGAKPAWPGDVTDASRIGTADIKPPKPVRMEPIMDEELDPSLPQRFTATPVSQGPEVVDAVSLAIANGAPQAVATTTQERYVAAPVAAAGKMRPVTSPEDDPAVLKARQEAKAKAAAEAKRKAREKAEAAETARRKAAEEEAARKAADEAAAAAAASASATPEPAAAPGTNTPSTTTTTTTTVAPAQENAPADTKPAATTTTTTTTTAPAPATVPSGPAALQSAPEAETTPADDMDKYLQGGN